MTQDVRRRRALRSTPAGLKSLPVVLALMVALSVAAQATPAAPDSPAFHADLPAHHPDATVARDQVPDVYKWNLGQLFADDAAWEAGCRELAARLPELARFRGRLADARALRECLDLYFALHNQANIITLHANLRLTTAQTDDACQAMQSRGLALMDDLMREAGFIRAEVLAMPAAKLDRALRREAGLVPYRAYLDNLRRRASRALGPEAERVLGLLGDNLWAEIDLNEIPSGYEQVFDNLLGSIPWPLIRDEQGAEVQLTLANYPRYRASPVREVRREAVQALLSTLAQYQGALAAALAGQLQLDVAYARARGYDTALAAYLDKDDIAVAVHDNLIATVNAHLEPLHRYVELRQRALGLPDVHLYDLYVPLAADVDVAVPFPEASRLIQEALAPLGQDYGRVLAHGLDPRQGWLDLYPHRGKDSGAFSASAYGRHPYVMMNYQDSLDDMSTLAHEYGHALHSHLAMAAQSYPDFRYAPFLAEIASTCNEVLLSDHLLARATDRAERIYLLVERLETLRTTIYRQTMFSEFERLAHGFVESGQPVTASLLNQTYAELLRRYYGPDYVIDEHDPVEWAYIPHFYYKYYVYAYATGLCSGIAIAERVRVEGEPAARAFLDMLAGGCSRPPLELLRGAGVDLTQPAPIEAALRLFARTLAELERLLAP